MEEKTIRNETRAEDMKYSQFLTFNLGNDVYGIAVNIIREVDSYGTVFPVPKAPMCVKGIINLRGDVIPVIDLNMRLFGIESRIHSLTNIIILDVEQEGEKTEIGVIIDSVKEVVDINNADIEYSTGFGLNLRKEFVTGIGKVHGNFVILLDVSSVLNVDEISQTFSATFSASFSASGKPEAAMAVANSSEDMKHGD